MRKKGCCKRRAGRDTGSGGGGGGGDSHTPSTGLRHLSFIWRKVPESDARSVGESVRERETGIERGGMEGEREVIRVGWKEVGGAAFPDNNNIYYVIFDCASH